MTARLSPQNGIRPDLSDENRCVSVHWTLPVQCVLPSSHRENWHEAWNPDTGNRLRYRRSMGGFATEDLHDGEWHDLRIPPPGGFCGIPQRGEPSVACTEQFGHGWNHIAVVDGVRHSWNTLPPNGPTADQLTRDVQQLRGMVVEAYELLAELAAVRAERDEVAVEVARFGIYGTATSAAKALVARASELVDENASLRAQLAKQRDEIADDIHRAELPVFAETENPVLVVKVVRAIDVRLAECGPEAPYWVAKAGDPR